MKSQRSAVTEGSSAEGLCFTRWHQLMLSYHVWVHATNLLSSPNQSSQLHPGVALNRRKMRQWQRVNELRVYQTFRAFQEWQHILVDVSGGALRRLHNPSRTIIPSLHHWLFPPGCEKLPWWTGQLSTWCTAASACLLRLLCPPDECFVNICSDFNCV